MKKCPYCAEEIQDAAIKCRYCRSDLQAAEPQAPLEETKPCPLCAEPIPESASRCEFCESELPKGGVVSPTPGSAGAGTWRSDTFDRAVVRIAEIFESDRLRLLMLVGGVGLTVLFFLPWGASPGGRASWAWDALRIYPGAWSTTVLPLAIGLVFAGIYSRKVPFSARTTVLLAPGVIKGLVWAYGHIARDSGFVGVGGSLHGLAWLVCAGCCFWICAGKQPNVKRMTWVFCVATVVLLFYWFLPSQATTARVGRAQVGILLPFRTFGAAGLYLTSFIWTVNSVLKLAVIPVAVLLLMKKPIFPAINYLVVFAAAVGFGLYPVLNTLEATFSEGLQIGVVFMDLTSVVVSTAFVVGLGRLGFLWDNTVFSGARR